MTLIPKSRPFSAVGVLRISGSSSNERSDRGVRASGVGRRVQRLPGADVRCGIGATGLIQRKTRWSAINVAPSGLGGALSGMGTGGMRGR